MSERIQGTNQRRTKLLSPLARGLAKDETMLDGKSRFLSSAEQEQILKSSKREKLFKDSGEKPLLIAVFGSSRVEQNDPLYRQAYELGRLLGKAGFDVATGGYRGVMEAVSQGARAGGAQVLGVTLSSFKEQVNPFVMREIRKRNMYSRMKTLIDPSDGYVALRGGMGTLAEVTFVWQMLALSLMPAKPFVLLGKEWRSVLDAWVKYLTVVESDYTCLTVVDKPEHAVEYLTHWFSAHSTAATMT